MDWISHVKGEFPSPDFVPQALLIEGGFPEDREEVAFAVAGYLLCSGENPPCGECRDCSQVNRGLHTSLNVVSDEEGEIKIDSVRRVMGEVSLKGFQGGRRVVLIHPADRMNRNSANALLKILEEPPVGVHFVLTCGSKGSLPVTIISRCILLRIPYPERSAFSTLDAGGVVYSASELVDALVRSDAAFIEEFSNVFRDEAVARRGILFLRSFLLALLELSTGSKRGIIEIECDEGKARKLASFPSRLREIYDTLAPLEDVRKGVDRAFLVRVALCSLLA